MTICADHIEERYWLTHHPDKCPKCAGDAVIWATKVIGCRSITSPTETRENEWTSYSCDRCYLTWTTEAAAPDEYRRRRVKGA